MSQFSDWEFYGFIELLPVGCFLFTIAVLIGVGVGGCIVNSYR